MVVVGTAVHGPPGAAGLDLVATFGHEAAMNRSEACLRTPARDLLSRPAG